MNARGSGAAWVVAGLAVAALIVAVGWGISQHTQIRSQRLELAELRLKAETLAARLAQHGQDAQPPEQPPSEPPADSGETSPTAPNEEAALPAEQPDARAAMLKTFEGERGRKLAEASAESMMDLQYGDLFAELALPPEIEKKVREILRDFAIRLLTGSAEAMKDGGSTEQFENDLRAEMKKDLSKLLTNEGMAIYDDYMATMPERMLRKGYTMQMAMYAPSLNEETRAMAVDVMVEEMMTVRHAADTGGDSAALNAARAEALDRARQRLSTVLDEQQMSQIDVMINQQRMQFERLREALETEK